MRAMLLEHVPNSLRESIAANAAEACRRVHALTSQYAEANQKRDYESANRIYAELAELCCPRNPAIRITGGRGGYVVFDEQRIRLVPANNPRF